MNADSACPLRGGIASSATARQHLRFVGEGWGAGLMESALLATSELVNNAVIHGGDPISLVVRTSADTVHIEVRDSGPTPVGLLRPDGDVLRTAAARPRTSGDDAELTVGGWGLHIVTALADRWGVSEQPQGKAVWFELGRTPGAAP